MKIFRLSCFEKQFKDVKPELWFEFCIAAENKEQAEKLASDFVMLRFKFSSDSISHYTEEIEVSELPKILMFTVND